MAKHTKHLCRRAIEYLDEYYQLIDGASKVESPGEQGKEEGELTKQLMHNPKHFIQAKLQKEEEEEEDENTTDSDLDVQRVSNLFIGCVKFEKLFNTTITNYLKRIGSLRDFARTSQLETNEMKVLLNLWLFDSDSLKVRQYGREFIATLNKKPTRQFLHCLSREEAQEGWLRTSWQSIYDAGFVQSQLLGSLRRCQSIINEILDDLQVKKDNSSKSYMMPTKSKPFNLTERKEITIEMPHKIIKTKQHLREIPKSTYPNPRGFNESSNKKNNLIKSGTKEKLIENFEQQQHTSALGETKQRASQKEITSIKMNTAAILREAHLYNKTEKQALLRLKELEAGFGNDEVFRRWQGEMQLEYERQRMEEIEQMRLRGLISYEQAIIAKQQTVESNKVKAQQYKQQKEKLQKNVLKRKEKEEEILKIHVQEIQTIQLKAKDAQENIRKLKSRAAQELNEESAKLLEEATRQAEEEMQQRMELIGNIREMQNRLQTFTKKVDLTQTAGYRFLSEMSILELKERMKYLKQHERDEENAKRKLIQEEKQIKDQQILNTLNKIVKHREHLEEKKSESRLANSRGKKISNNSEANSDLKSQLASLRERKKNLRQLQTLTN